MLKIFQRHAPCQDDIFAMFVVLGRFDILRFADFDFSAIGKDLMEALADLADDLGQFFQPDSGR